MSRTKRRARISAISRPLWRQVSTISFSLRSSCTFKGILNSGREAAGGARDTAEQAIEATRLLDRLEKSGALKAGSLPSYNRSERSEMQRLIESKLKNGKQ